MFRPNFSAKMKNVVQPTRIFCTLRISWKRISDWLPIVFRFGTENGEEQLKKTSCIRAWLSWKWLVVVGCCDWSGGMQCSVRAGGCWLWWLVVM